MAKLAFVVGEYEYGGDSFNIYEVLTFQNEVTEAEGIAIIKRDMWKGSSYVIKPILLTELRPVQRTVYQAGE